MRTFKDILKEVKIDLTKTILSVNSGESIGSEFEISPKDFLRFAKRDLNDGDERGLINGLTNAKRAIDCQIDEALWTFGIKIQNKPKEVEAFVKCFDFDNDIPFKLKVIQGLNLAPGFLISRTRTLRNKLEHYYKKPSKKEVRESIEIAELFLLSVQGKLKLIETDFILTDENQVNEDGKVKNKIAVFFDIKTKKFRVTSSVANEKKEPIEVSCLENEFFGLLRLMNSIDDEVECEESLELILSQVGHPIPKNKIKCVGPIDTLHLSLSKILNISKLLM